MKSLTFVVPAVYSDKLILDTGYVLTSGNATSTIWLQETFNYFSAIKDLQMINHLA
jgi:hypothetical protein